MEKFTKPELLNFLCDDNVGKTDNQFMNSPLSGKNKDDNPEGL